MQHTITKSQSDNFARFANGSDAIRATGANGCEMIPEWSLRTNLIIVAGYLL